VHSKAYKFRKAKITNNLERREYNGLKEKEADGGGISKGSICRR
jgi:hypothetical protein